MRHFSNNIRTLTCLTYNKKFEIEFRTYLKPLLRECIMVNNYTRKRCFYGILYKYRIYDTVFISIKPNIWEIYGRPTIENYFFCYEIRYNRIWMKSRSNCNTVSSLDDLKFANIIVPLSIYIVIQNKIIQFTRARI